jgi:hypothetical protein
MRSYMFNAQLTTVSYRPTNWLAGLNLNIVVNTENVLSYQTFGTSVLSELLTVMLNKRRITINCSNCLSGDVRKIRNQLVWRTAHILTPTRAPMTPSHVSWLWRLTFSPDRNALFRWPRSIAWRIEHRKVVYSCKLYITGPQNSSETGHSDRAVLARLFTEIVGSNPIRGMNVNVSFSVFMLFWV